MKYHSVADTAKSWNVSERTVRNYCATGKIPGAVLTGKTWNIPQDAKRPARTNKKPEVPRTLLDVLQNEMTGQVKGGIYHKIQIDLTYNSNHIEGSRLTHEQTRFIFETNTVGITEEGVRVDDIIKTGTMLDSTVAAELLKNLFWNKAPLHDGAVIVRNGHIVGAGCVLPLSGNVNLSRDLGMRHRAGIGMSENSDAVVAIVSEETGSISVAVNGMLKRHLAPETLERLLRNELLPQEESSSKSSILTSLFKSKKGDKDDGEEVHGK